ncbi:MAG: D-aminoacyl-tRNA deacylase [Gammaproteobacteria bacterium]|nr:MAG: D-aminoacyl-tRNA deacylase [Gammaproteobacteria bacterium]
MLCLAQRVKKASVRVNKDLVSSIDKGILLMVCFEQTDTQVQIDKLISKILDYSFFEGVSGKLDASLRKIGAELLIVSQFTLNASTKKGLKPSFHKAASPDLAEELYNKLKASINLEYKNVKYGVFGAYMELELTNDGPFTLNFNF